MSLPTASLGQLPTMSMPYSIPTYEKPPSIWEKALASFLVNAAGSVAKQAGENVMTRDSAAEFGEKPATGFGRLLGPQVGPDEARQRRQNLVTSAEAEKGRQFTASEGQRDREFTTGRDTQRAMTDQARSDREGTLALSRIQQQAMNQEKEQYMQNVDQRALAQLKARLELENPETPARTRFYEAQANRYQADADYQQDRNKDIREMPLKGGRPPTSGVGPATAAPTSSITDAIRRFAQNSADDSRAVLPGTQPGRTIQDILNEPPEGASSPSANVVYHHGMVNDAPSLPADANQTSAIMEWLRQNFGFTNDVQPSSQSRP